MSTAQIDFGPWVMRLSVGRRADSRQWVRGLESVREATASPADHPVTVETTEIELDKLGREAAFEDARRSSHARAGMLGIRI